MMKNKKSRNSKGMTLVEIIVAMTIFMFISLMVCTTFEFASNVDSKSKMRNYEIDDQALAIENRDDDRVSDFPKEAGDNKFEMTFGDALEGVSEKNGSIDVYRYSANNQKYKEYISTRLRFLTTNSLDTSGNFTPTATLKKIEFKNTSLSPITIKVSAAEGWRIMFQNESKTSPYIFKVEPGKTIYVGVNQADATKLPTVLASMSLLDDEGESYGSHPSITREGMITDWCAKFTVQGDAEATSLKFEGYFDN